MIRFLFDVIVIVAFPLMVLFVLSLVASLRSILVGGISRQRQFSRAGFTLKALYTASLPEGETPLRTRRGLAMRSTKNGLVIRPTHSISKDEF